MNTTALQMYQFTAQLNKRCYIRLSLTKHNLVNESHGRTVLHHTANVLVSTFSDTFIVMVTNFNMM